MATVLRPARKSDATALAALVDMAGEGMPVWMGSQMREPVQDRRAHRLYERTGYRQIASAPVARFRGGDWLLLIKRLG